MVTAATIYMSLIGPEGLRRIAAQSHANTLELVEQMEKISSVKRTFSGATFHEAVLTLPKSTAGVLAQLRQNGILGGFDLQAHYPELGNALLVCATETKTAGDLQNYANAMKQALG